MNQEQEKSGEYNHTGPDHHLVQVRSRDQPNPTGRQGE
jgi:hypothetical protein